VSGCGHRRGTGICTAHSAFTWDGHIPSPRVEHMTRFMIEQVGMAPHSRIGPEISATPYAGADGSIFESAPQPGLIRWKHRLSEAVLSEAVGITVDSWYAWPSTRPGYELVAAGMLIMAAGHDGKPLDYDELERWTRVGYERGMRSRKVRAVSRR
jgi:hypothetical protein